MLSRRLDQDGRIEIEGRAYTVDYFEARTQRGTQTVQL